MKTILISLFAFFFYTTSSFANNSKSEMRSASRPQAKTDTLLNPTIIAGTTIKCVEKSCIKIELNKLKIMNPKLYVLMYRIGDGKFVIANDTKSIELVLKHYDPKEISTMNGEFIISGVKYKADRLVLLQ